MDIASDTFADSTVFYNNNYDLYVAGAGVTVNATGLQFRPDSGDGCEGALSGIYSFTAS